MHGAGASVAGVTDLEGLLQASLGPSVNLINCGIGGRTISGATTAASGEVDAFYNSLLAKNICIVWLGANDLPLGSTALDIYNGLVAYSAARRSVGWKVVMCTMTDRNNGSYSTKQVAANLLITTDNNTSWDATANLGANSLIGISGASANTTYFLVDQIHVNDAGYIVAAPIVQAAVQPLL